MLKFFTLFGLLTVLPSLTIQAQPEKHKINIHWVELTDKENTPYSLLHPTDFLSPRAIERRQRQGIELSEQDLPVDPAYLKQITDAGGEIHGVLKWFNAVAVYTENKEILEAVKKLPCVRSVDYLGKKRKVKPYKHYTKRKYQTEYKTTDSPYGFADNQITMLNGHLIHQFGYRGEGMQVAIFDGGFMNVYRMPAFDSLYNDDRMLGTHDFVEGDDYVYEASSHGTNVLATMASDLEGMIVGTAPDASYYLFKTEDVAGEFRIEEFNWVAAAERADSLGVDVINSSLGYTHFSDTTMHYEYEDMDGKTALCSRGANIAAEKGILVVNSAGNEGNDPWHYIGAPADAPNVMAVGAVRANRKRSYFSSYGPTADGRIKPNVAARGSGTVVASMMGYDISRSDGTSFSAPVMAGMVTAFWQAFPELTNMEIKRIVEISGDQSTEPDSSLGYGIPNFFGAYIMLQEGSALVDMKGNAFGTKNLVDKKFSVFAEADEESVFTMRVYNQLYAPIYEVNDTLQRELKEFIVPGVENWEGGVYPVMIEIRGQRHWFEIVKKWRQEEP